MKKFITIFEPLNAFQGVGYPSTPGVELGNVSPRFYCLCNSFSSSINKIWCWFFLPLRFYHDKGICFARKRIARQPKKVFFNT